MNESNITQTTPMKLDVAVRPVESEKNLLAFASVTINDCFKVHGIKVVNGEKGIFIDMPSTQDSNGKYRDICYPVTSDFRKQLSDAVLDSYDATVVKMQTFVQTAERIQRAPSKPPLGDQIKNAAKQAQAHNANRPLAAHTAAKRQAASL